MRRVKSDSPYTTKGIPHTPHYNKYIYTYSSSSSSLLGIEKEEEEEEYIYTISPSTLYMGI